MRRSLSVGVAILVMGCGTPSPEVPVETDPATVEPVLIPLNSGTSQRLQAVSVVSDQIVWASGTGGTVARTTDGGATWTTQVVPGADSLEFRDVEGFDSLTAYLLAAGPGDRSRIYKTVDGGTTWDQQFVNAEPRAFFDCFAFWGPAAGLAMSDAVDNAFVFARTVDGTTWHLIPPDSVPAALPGEGAFAASGTCLVSRGDSTVWLGTGASGEAARVLRSTDRGMTWTETRVPVVGDTPSAGLTSLAFLDDLRGVGVGGDLSRPTDTLEAVAITRDGGKTWQRGGALPFSGSAYVVAVVPGLRDAVVAAGPNGAGWSRDLGQTWLPLDTLNYWAGAFANSEGGWLVGPGGRIAKVVFRARPRETD